MVVEEEVSDGEEGQEVVLTLTGKRRRMSKKQREVGKDLGRSTSYSSYEFMSIRGRGVILVSVVPLFMV